MGSSVRVRHSCCGAYLSCGFLRCQVPRTDEALEAGSVAFEEGSNQLRASGRLLDDKSSFWLCKAWERDHDLSVATPQLYRDDDGFAGTAPVGSFPKGDTQRGAHDMVGNVWEWTADWYDVYGAAEATNPKGAPAGERKAIRGGGFNGGAADWVNPAFRYHQLATASSPAIGFRCAADLGGG